MPDKEKEVEKLLKRVHQVIEDAKTARDENRKLVAQMRELLKGSRFTGSMYFDDPESCKEMDALFKSKVGCSIREIGDLELS